MATTKTIDSPDLITSLLLDGGLLLFLANELQEAGTTVHQFCCLCILAEKEAFMGDLGPILGHTKQASSGTVERMEKLGLVKRTNLRDDRRRVQVEITKAGRKIVERVRASLARYVSELEP